MTGDCKDSAFKVKVRVGGVNVLQHTINGERSQDYFVVSEQKWVWGTQVGKDTARQFRVFRHGREKYVPLPACSPRFPDWSHGLTCHPLQAFSPVSVAK